MIKQLGHRTLFDDNVGAGAFNIDLSSNVSAIGARFTVNATTIAAGSIDVTVQAYDESSGTYADIEGADIEQLTAPGFTDLLLYPGIFVIVNRALSTPIFKRLRLVVTVAGTADFTIGADWLG